MTGVSPSPDELAAAYAVINAAHRQEIAERCAGLRALVGWYFKLRNTLGSGQGAQHWWAYGAVTQVDDDMTLHGLAFECRPGAWIRAWDAFAEGAITIDNGGGSLLYTFTCGRGGESPIERITREEFANAASGMRQAAQDYFAVRPLRHMNPNT